MRKIWKGCRTQAALRNFSPHYRRQFAAAFLKQVWREMEQQEKRSPQLMPCKDGKAAAAVRYEGALMQWQETNRWKEKYLTVRSDYTVNCFDTKEACEKGWPPQVCVPLTRCVLLSSLKEYNAVVDSAAQGLKESSSTGPYEGPFMTPLSKYILVLFHPYRRPLCFCCPSSVTQQAWQAVLSDGIRHHNTVLQRRRSFEVEALLDAVRFYRQERCCFGTGDWTFGEEMEILSNMVMEELVPVLQTQLIPSFKGPVQKRRRTWFKVLEEVYFLVTDQVSQELLCLKRENKEQRLQLEKKVRSNLDQILTLKEQISRKLQALVRRPADCCYSGSLQPYLDSMLEELMLPISAGFKEIRSLFSDTINNVLQNLRNGQKSMPLDRLLPDLLLDLPQNSLKMYPCYLKVEVFRDNLAELTPRFGFEGVGILIQTAQNLIQELMENAVYTFLQLLQPQLNSKLSSAQASQLLENVKGRVLKKFDYDSSTSRKQFVGEALILVLLPVMLKALEPSCKLELSKYEDFVFADYSGVILIENIYEEVLFLMLQQEIKKALKEASSQKNYSLYRESLMCILDSEENLFSPDTLRNQPETESLSGALPLDLTDTGSLPTSKLAENIVRTLEANAAPGYSGHHERQNKNVVLVKMIDSGSMKHLEHVPQSTPNEVKLIERTSQDDLEGNVALSTPELMRKSSENGQEENLPVATAEGSECREECLQESIAKTTVEESDIIGEKSQKRSEEALVLSIVHQSEIMRRTTQEFLEDLVLGKQPEMIRKISVDNEQGSEFLPTFGQSEVRRKSHESPGENLTLETHAQFELVRLSNDSYGENDAFLASNKHIRRGPQDSPEVTLVSNTTEQSELVKQTQTFGEGNLSLAIMDEQPQEIRQPSEDNEDQNADLVIAKLLELRRIAPGIEDESLVLGTNEQLELVKPPEDSHGETYALVAPNEFIKRILQDHPEEILVSPTIEQSELIEQTTQALQEDLPLSMDDQPPVIRSTSEDNEDQNVAAALATAEQSELSTSQDTEDGNFSLGTDEQIKMVKPLEDSHEERFSVDNQPKLIVRNPQDNPEESLDLATPEGYELDRRLSEDKQMPRGSFKEWEVPQDVLSEKMVEIFPHNIKDTASPLTKQMTEQIPQDKPLTEFIAENSQNIEKVNCILDQFPEHSYDKEEPLMGEHVCYSGELHKSASQRQKNDSNINCGKEESFKTAVQDLEMNFEFDTTLESEGCIIERDQVKGQFQNDPSNRSTMEINETTRSTPCNGQSVKILLGIEEPTETKCYEEEAKSNDESAHHEEVIGSATQHMELVTGSPYIEEADANTVDVKPLMKSIHNVVQESIEDSQDTETQKQQRNGKLGNTSGQ
nr:PREDICTED: protein Niban-like isoform X2 [Latimeria chalumnae]|eukprot:XP_006002976.1 PREDICTED: protein Niban-like isoform X2 [Latimeria chalumnae]